MVSGSNDFASARAGMITTSCQSIHGVFSGSWKQVLGRVGSFADLEPALLGRVEELIDFVTADQGDR